MSGKQDSKKGKAAAESEEQTRAAPRKRTNLGRPFTSSRARVASFTHHMNMTPEQEREHAKKMAEARWAKHRAERVAQGLPPTKPRRPLLSYEELLPWLEKVDEEFPKETFDTPEDRKRRAMLLARRSLAHDELEVAKSDGADKK